MEEEGIFYFFKHEQGKHTLVLADQKSGYFDCPEKPGRLPPRPRQPGDRGPHHAAGSTATSSARGKWAQTDYNFEDHPARSAPLPAKLMMTNENTTVNLPDAKKYEFYDFPGTFAKKDDGDGYTKLRMEEEEVRVRRGAGRQQLPLLHARRQVQNPPPHVEVRGRQRLRHHFDPARGAGVLRDGRGGGFRLPKQFHLHSRLRGLPPGADLAAAADPRRAAGRRHRAGGRGNLSRQVRPREGAVLLGPRGQARRQKLLLDSRLAGLRRQGLGQRHHPPHRPGGAGLLPGRRSRPADHHRPRLQRRPDPALSAAQQENGQRAEVQQHARRRRLQRIHLRRHQGQRADPRARPVRQGLHDRARPPRARQARPPTAT